MLFRLKYSDKKKIIIDFKIMLFRLLHLYFNQTLNNDYLLAFVDEKNIFKKFCAIYSIKVNT